MDKQGNLAFPLVGIIPAAGQTPRQLAATIRAYLENPTVLVQYTTHVSILGEVARPGIFVLNNTFALRWAE